jgi:hypothetical protein
MAKFDDLEIESIIPQFLILPKSNEKNYLISANVDFAVFGKDGADGGKKRAFFVELKTDNNSFDKKRLKHLRDYKEIRQSIDLAIKIYNKGDTYKDKYRVLLAEGLKDIVKISNVDLESFEQKKVAEYIKPSNKGDYYNCKPDILYIVPSSEPFEKILKKDEIIDFDEICKYLKNFADSLEETKEKADIRKNISEFCNFLKELIPPKKPKKGV